ncbi:MAG: multicomponent Na+:H+ antiporter subunit E [Gammaproteobacteria bacterium]|jgi:multicomponent Na+:H+ antiporter subunit E
MIKNKKKPFTPYFLRLLVLAAAWVLLTKAAASSWVVGIIVVPIAALLSLSLFRRPDEMKTQSSINWFRLLCFTPYFLWLSLKGGWQTARLAFQPSMSLNPYFMHHNSVLPYGAARIFFLNFLSLLPGTFSARLEGAQLTIHVLQISPQSRQEICDCEQYVAWIFDIDLKQPVRAK